MNRDDVLRVAKECGLELSVDPCVIGRIIERFAAAMYAAGAADMKERAAIVCDEMFAGQVGAVHVAATRCAKAIRDLPITPTNTVRCPNCEGTGIDKRDTDADGRVTGLSCDCTPTNTEGEQA